MPTLTEYIHYRMLPRLDSGLHTVSHTIVPAMVDSLRTIGEQGVVAAKALHRTTKPLVRESAAQVRHAVEHHVVPGMITVGRHTVDGVKAGAAAAVDVLAEAVMGQQAKEETFGAIGTLARAVMYGNETGAPPGQQRHHAGDYYFQSSEHDPVVFHYDYDAAAAESGDGDGPQVGWCCRMWIRLKANSN